MRIQIGEAPSPTFAEPIRLLGDCHRRVERFLGVIRSLSLLPAGTALDAHAREALATALRYFEEAAPRHTADEEESLFPRLRAAGSAEADAVLALLDRLEGDHDRAAPDHEAVDRLGRQWLGAGTLDPAGQAELEASAGRLERLYRDHIAVEDGSVFPCAARVLGAGTLRDVGVEMARRRGVPFTPGKAPVP